VVFTNPETVMAKRRKKTQK